MCMKKFNDFLNFFNKKRITLIIKCLFWLSLVPMIWIGFYNRAGADDFSIGLEAHLAWESSHNIFAVIWAGIVRGYEDWLTWMGYYTSNFLMAVPPNAFSEKLYIISTPLLLGLLIASTVYLFRNILVRWLQADKNYADCVIYLMLFIIIQCMVSPIEAFYWYCGASNYIITHAMCMWFFGLLISCYYDRSIKSNLWVKPLLIGILGFFTAGGNQLTALNGAIIIVAMWAVFIFSRKAGKNSERNVESKFDRSKITGLILPSAMYMVGFLLNILAPGNSVRAEGTAGMNPIKAVLISIHYYLDYCLGEWLTWPVIVVLIVLVPIFLRMFRNTTFKFRYPIIVVLFGCGLTAAMMTPSLYAVGSIEAGRLQDMTFVMFIMTLVLSEGYVIGWINQKLDQKDGIKLADSDAGFNELGNSDRILILTCLVAFIIGTGLAVIPNNHYFCFSSALTDLANGSASQYAREIDERTELFKSGTKDVCIERVSVEPRLIFFSDIDGTDNEWVRNALCKYYHLDSLEVVTK